MINLIHRINISLEVDTRNDATVLKDVRHGRLFGDLFGVGSNIQVWVLAGHSMADIELDQRNSAFREVMATESATIGTVTQTAAFTTTYVIQCTNSLIHKLEQACDDGSALPFFIYEAPGTNHLVMLSICT